MNSLSTSFGPLEEATNAALARIRDADVVARLWKKDHTVWSPDATEISNRMGWMDSPEVMTEHLAGIDSLVDAVRAAGFTHALLLGMGGSSLAPELFREVFDVAEGYLDLAVLDSTDPQAVRSHADRLDPAKTLFIPATKSGGTVETISFLKYFYNLTIDAVGAESVGDHFVAITDPGSGLEEMAGALDFRHVFLNDPDIGGRYSALSFFGLVPARLLGVDLQHLLIRAREAVVQCRSPNDNPGVILGAAIGCGALVGRDKLTLAASPEVAALGAWIEQLIAESTGKEGKGIVPVDGERLADPDRYADDRLFAGVRLAGDASFDGRLDTLGAAGHPYVTLDMGDTYDVAGQFVIWETATVTASHLLAINPYDQPNVEAAKVVARAMTEAYHRDGSLPSEDPTASDGELEIYGAAGAADLSDALTAFFADGKKSTGRSYVCLQAYVPPCQDTDAALDTLRLAIRDRHQLATTVGYGPRFLHSTGQLHKGDGGHGLFLQFTCDDACEADIPDDAGSSSAAMSFSVLKAAQARGDRQALIDAGRRVLRIHLGSDVAAGIGRVARAVIEID